jgi:hypothetical protein
MADRIIPGLGVFQDPANGGTYLAPGGSVVQTPPAQLAPGLLENEQTFYGPTVVVPQPYRVSRLLPGGAVFQYRGDGRHYLLPGGQVVQAPPEIRPPLLVNEQAFFGPTITQEAQAAVGVPWRDRGALPVGQLDDRDLLEILPIVIGALNASRTH